MNRSHLNVHRDKKENVLVTLRRRRAEIKLYFFSDSQGRRR